jgi:hypothetical protein
MEVLYIVFETKAGECEGDLSLPGPIAEAWRSREVQGSDLF